jgi:6-phosphogluconolactonase
MIASAQEYFLFTGTYTTGSSKGIYVFRFNAADGSATPLDSARISQPSYLAVSHDGNFVYAVSETGGNTPGSISAFSFDKQSGKLTLLNTRTSFGDYPCYITVSPNRKWVIAGNYGSGNFVAYGINSDGSISDNYQEIRHAGSGKDRSRQEGPHVHSTVFTPDNKFLLVSDLGLDRIMIYSFDESAKEKPLKAAKQSFAEAVPGSGPRHLAFHPNGRWLFLIEEMSGNVSSWQYKNGTLKRTNSIDAHAPGYKGDRGSADIHVSADGRFLYASNRYAANDIAIFSIDQKNGNLKYEGSQDVIGKKPRNFTLSPEGKYLLVANQETDDIRIFRRNPETGKLTNTENIIHVGNPVCLQLYPIR